MAPENKKQTIGWLTGQILIASPNMADPRFVRTVIYLCSHGPSGAMGLVVNRIYGELNFKGLLSQLKVEAPASSPEIPIHFGGPVEPGRGFVLHTAEYSHEGTMSIDGKFSMTATLEILKSIAEGKGPDRALLALGYAGWSAGQLDAELQTNGWIVAAAEADVIFNPDNDVKWEQALSKVGIHPLMLSTDIGHA